MRAEGGLLVNGRIDLLALLGMCMMSVTVRGGLTSRLLCVRGIFGSGLWAWWVVVWS